MGQDFTEVQLEPDFFSRNAVPEMAADVLLAFTSTLTLIVLPVIDRPGLTSDACTHRGIAYAAGGDVLDCADELSSANAVVERILHSARPVASIRTPFELNIKIVLLVF